MADVQVIRVAPRRFAGVRRLVRQGEVPHQLIAGLDVVWQVIRAGSFQGVGHNVAVYRYLGDGLLEMQCGVEVVEAFEPVGEVVPREIPGGLVVWARHVGPYERLSVTYTEVDRHVATLPAQTTGVSWEVYGDSTDDPAKLETEIYVLLSDGHAAPP